MKHPVLEAWHLGALFHTLSKPLLVACENIVDLLEAETPRFRIQEVDHRRKRNIEDGPDEPIPPTNVRQSDRCDSHDDPVEEPVGGGSECGPLTAHLETVNLRCIHPRHIEVAEGECIEEEEKHCCNQDAPSSGWNIEADTDQGKDDRLGNCAPYHRLSSVYSVDEKDGGSADKEALQT